MTKHVIKWTTLATVVAVLVTVLLVCLPAPTAQAATLKQGSTGALVRTVQTKLKNWGYYTGTVDGIYGAKTAAAVRYFQRKNGLTQDGVVGPQTAKAMGISLSSSGSVSATILSRSSCTSLLSQHSAKRLSSKSLTPVIRL